MVEVERTQLFTLKYPRVRAVRTKGLKTPKRKSKKDRSCNGQHIKKDKTDQTCYT